MATNQNNNLNNTDTSSANTGGISVSGQSQGPVPATERIRQAREQIYQTLATDKFTFDEFSAVLDDSEVSGQLIQKLVENEKLSGWTSDSLQGALFEGKLNEVSSEGSETTSATSTEPAAPSQSSSIDEATLAEQSTGEGYVLPEGATDLTNPAEGIYAYYDPNLTNVDTGEMGDVVNRLEAVEVRPTQEQLPQEDPLTAKESIKNSLKNIGTQLRGFDDRAVLTSTGVMTWLFGEETARKVYNFLEVTDLRDFDSAREDAIAELRALGDEMLPTLGIVESWQDRDVKGLAAGVVNGASSMVSTLITGALTLGGGIGTEMIGGAFDSYNTAKAEDLGISTEELYRTKQADFGTPLLIGSIGTALEAAGMGGVVRSMTANITSAAAKRLALLGVDMNKEGMTELVQYGLEEYGNAIATGATQGEAVQRLGAALVSVEGLETYLQGASGAGVTAGGTQAARSILNREARGKVTENYNKIKSIVNDLAKVQDPSVKEQMLNSAGELASEINTISNENNETLETLTPEQVQQATELTNNIESITETLANDAESSSPMSPETREVLEQRREQLGTELDAIVSNIPETTNENIEGSGQVPVEDGQVAPVAEEAGATQELVETTPAEVPAGSRLFSEPVAGLTELSAQYKTNNSIDTPEGQPIRRLDRDRSARIADAYEAMEHNPNDPQVRESYEAMATETLQQFETIREAGYTVELWDGQGEPYANSTAMLDDLRNNNHLYVLPTEAEFGETPITDQQRQENPLLRDSGITDANGRRMLINDVFRFVHDVFGHGERGNSFGALGEENAWDVHARMYSDTARRAMTTETRGQNSWVNFGPHLRNAEGQVPRRGEEGFTPVTERPFAEQKIGLLPEEFSQLEEVAAPVQQNEVFTENEQSGIVNAIGEIDGVQDTPGLINSVISNIADTSRRKARISELANNLRENIRQDENLGISQDNRAKARRDLEFLRDLTEYAILNIADGVVTSAESFKEMARGLGDFGDAVLDRAYYAASRVAGEYAATNSETTDTAIGEVLARIQDSSLDRTPAQTRVTSRQVRELTDGGTRGRVVQTMRAAIRDYYATLQRGARIGTKAQRDRARAFNKNLRDTLTEYYKTAPVSLTKAMTRSDLNRLTRKIAVAETDAHLEQIMDSLDKLTSKAENVARFESLKRLKAKSKSRSKSTLLPANVREPFGRFASMDPLELMRYLDDSSVSNLITLLSEIDASVKQGEPNRSMIGSISEVNNILKNLGNRLEKARFERELPKMEAHLEELSEASGMEYETPTTFSEYNVAVQDMEAELIRQGKSAPRTKSTARTNNERTVLNNLPMLDEVNLEDYTDNEVAAIEAIKSLTQPILEKLSDADVMKLSMVIPNLLGNERLDGVGSVAYKIKSYQLAADESFTQPVRKALLDVPALGSFFMRFFSNPSSFNRAMRTFMSDSQRFDSLFRDVFTKGKFLGKFGIEQYKQGKNVAQRRYESSQDRFGVMARKDKDVKAFMNSSNRGEREALLGIYAWANQHQTGLTENQQQQLFERKMETLRGMVASMTGDTNRFDWLTRETLEASINNTISAIERAVEAKNIGELRGMLGAGEMKVYNFALNEFASLRPEFLANARLYNNVDLDTNIDNYTPISYQFFDDKASDAFLETSYDRAYSTTKITGQSGSRSSKDRIIKDGTLPRDGILDFSFIGNTFKDIGLQLADIHTQGPRMQIHHNLNNNDLKQAVNGSNFFGTIQAMMTEDMRTNYSYFSSPRAMTIARKLMRAYSDSVYGRALGGLTQTIKQWIPTATDVLVRTADPRTFFTYFNPLNRQYRRDVGAFIANSDIARRGVQSSQMGQSVLNNVDVGEIRNKALRGVDRALDVHHDVINKGVLAGLRFGDVEAAKAAWITYYKQYADRNGIPVDLSAAPNPEAAAFADNQVDITANTSVDAGKAKFTQSMIAKALIPFSGAAFTSLMNLSVSTSKWMTAMRIGDGPAARENMNAMVANILTITMFQMTGWGIRWASYYGLKEIGQYAIDSIDLDDEEEEENLKEVLNLTLDDYVKKRVERNIENSSYYLVNDLIHRGLLSQGPLESAADAIIKPAFEKVTGFNISTYRSTDPAEALFNTMGLYGILPAGIHSMFTKNSGLFSTRADELRHSGYGSYLTAEGEVEYDLPEGRNMPQELRTFNKTMQLLSIPAAFGIQDQFTSSITRTSPALYRQLEKEIFKGVPKASKASREKAFENKFNNLNHKGKTMKLDNKEAKLFRKYYDQTYKEEYEKYRESRLPFIGDGPKMEELAMKHIYKLTKDKLMADTEFKKLWDAKAEKSNK